jgi:anti-sigma regulatory factor (Ser/Thr protein kinase)
MQTKPKNSTPVQDLVCGQFSKREAAQIIATGVSHLHASPLGTNEPLALVTASSIKTSTLPLYTWETSIKSTDLTLVNSEDRAKLIKKIASQTGIENRNEFSDKLGLVMEELLTNAIYHSYENGKGGAKYGRKENVKLNASEIIQIKYFGDRKGIYISVTDRGGTMIFQHMMDSFLRNYGDASNQLESKSSGAGLGLYMIFELVTHLKISISPAQRTTISCWLPDNRSYDPNFFTFNFFDGRFK